MENLLSVLRNEFGDLYSEIEPVNLLVVGLSGVGKSTLINAVFGRKLAKVGIGEPVTMKIEQIKRSDLPLAIYDTRGLEVKNSDETIKEVEDFIVERRNSPNMIEQVHIAWLCILEQHKRVEDIHKYFLELFSKYEIPCVIVITQPQDLEDDFVKKVEEITNHHDIIPVMAEPKITRAGTIPPEGLKELVDRTIALIPESQETAFIYCQRADWNRKTAKAKEVINWAAGVAAGAPWIPIPGGGAAALSALQVAMIVKINHAVGIDYKSSKIAHLISGMLPALGGRVAVTEALKLFPGVGTIAAGLIGSAAAVSFTKATGELYLNVARGFAQKNEKMPDVDELLATLKDALKKNFDYYKSM